MKRRNRLIGVGLVLILIAAGGVAFWLREPPKDKGGVTPQLLSRAIEVLAVTENGKQFREAITGWSELLESRPDDRALLINQAVTVLKWIANTNSALSSGTISDPTEQEALDRELQEAYSEADRVLAKLAQSAPEGGQSTGQQSLLESALLESRSRVVADQAGLELRRSAAEKLLDALKSDPNQPLLAARLLGLSQELQPDWPEVAAIATEAAYKTWQAQPRNLFLLVRTGEGLLAQKDPRLLETLDVSMELARPLLSMLPSARQLQPDLMASAVRSAVEAGDWPKAQRIRGWFNILTASSAFRADSRLVNPDILALLDTAFLERWRQLLPDHDKAAQSQPPVEVAVHELSSVVPPAKENSEPLPALLAWYDYDVDRDFDVLAIHGQQLRITPLERSDSAEPQKPIHQSLGQSTLELSLPIQPLGLCIVDLWTVDSPQRPRVRQIVASQPNEDAQDSNRHDTLQELVLWNSERVIVVARDSNDNNVLKALDEVAGLSNLAAVQQMVPLDLDSDGDLDLAVTTQAGLTLLQNNGNRTFEDISQFSSLSPDKWTAQRLVACDFDRDLDLDLVGCSLEAPHLAVYENILHSQFRFRALDQDHWRGNQALRDAAVGDFDGNASWDWCTVGERSVSGVLTRTTAPGVTLSASRFDRELGPDAQLDLLCMGDLNLDGYLDACAAGTAGVMVYYGTGSGITDKPHAIHTGNVRRLDVCDADRDGKLELLALVDNKASVLLIQPASGHEAHYLQARIRGIADVNGGGRINHFAIGSVLEVWSGDRYQARVIDSPATHFGLPASQTDNLRIIFNNGLTQNALKPRADTLVEERQELRGSCPFVYGWDGERFQLITDLLWNAPLGLQVARGQVLPDRRWENLLLPGQLVQPREGAIELRVTEELWEVAYFDHVALTAIDHPSDIEVWTNEKVGPPALAEHRLFTASRPLRPTAARDGFDRDVLPQLMKRDRLYAQAFDRQICQGLCEPHSIDLTFDPRELGQRNDLRLVLTGWMYPTDTSLNIGIDQNPERSPPAPPSLWAPNSHGEFVCVQPFMGFPGGKPKTIVVDLNSVFTGDDTRLRIAASQQIYWDEAYIIADEPPAPLRSERLALQTAQLHYRGFSELMPRASDQPHWYDYASVDRAAKWPPLEGPFTAFGNVLRSMQADDDRMVVMSSGDEMILRFALPSRTLPSGWRRDYVLHSVGWDKDADINTLEGQSSLPLPFAAMKSYPPPPEQTSESDRVWQINVDSLTERSVYDSFWHPLRPQ